MFSLAGRLRPGKKAIACGEGLFISELAVALGPTPKPNCPEGCGLLPDRRLPSGQKENLLSALCASVVNLIVKIAIH